MNRNNEIKKEAGEYIKKHPKIKDEFLDLVYSDPNFNYSKNEIIDWTVDCVLPR